jgi:uncharacterized protein (TIGR03437 family)
MRIRVIFFLLSVAGLGFAQSPVISNNGMVNAASFTTPIAPGSLFSIFGSGLASSVATADSIPLSKSLGGVTVEFIQGNNTFNAALLFVQPDDAAKNITSQINAQVPWEVDPTQQTQVKVTVNGNSSAPVQAPVAASGPGIFASNGFAIAVNNDGTLTWAPGTVPGLTTHGAKAGDTIIVYTTGLGSVGPAPPADGADSIDELRRTTATPIVLVGGVPAPLPLPFSGLTPQFVGVYQINVTIPDGVTPGSNVPLQLQIGGITTANNTIIAITQ